MVSEDISLFSHRIFHHSKLSNSNGYFDTEYNGNLDENLLKYLQNVLLNPQADQILTERRTIEPVDREILKKGLIYNFLQCALGSNKNEFLSHSENWAPFNGKHEHLLEECEDFDLFFHSSL